MYVFLHIKKRKFQNYDLCLLGYKKSPSDFSDELIKVGGDLLSHLV